MAGFKPRSHEAMATSSSSVDDLIAATNYLTGGAGEKNEVEKAIKVIRGVAKESGLEPDCIEVLMDYVLGKEGGGNATVRTFILRCLIPRTTVPVMAVFRAISYIPMLSHSLRLLLFKWMVLTFDLVDRKEKLLVMYDVIFQYLGYDTLRGLACQLLCYMTTRKHVREFRVQQLMELYKKVIVHSKEACESSLMALLAIYKLHCPHLVPIGNPSGRKVWFRPGEKDLANSIEMVQRRRPDSPVSVTTSAGRIHRCLDAVPPPAKRRKKAESIPAHLPSQSHSHGKTDDSELLVPIATITNIQELCDCIHRLELPGQMASVLKYPLVRHVLSIWPDPSAAQRLAYWLPMALAPELDSYDPSNPESPWLLQILDCIVQVTEFLMESVPPMETFLLIMLESWNGSDYRTQVLRLLSYLSLQSFEDVEFGYLQPLKRLFVEKDSKFKRSVLACLTDLLKFWAALEWPRYQQRLQGCSRIGVFPSSLWNREKTPDFDPLVSMSLLIRHTEDLLRIALFQEQGHALINHAAATFYEVVTSLPGEQYEVPLTLIPHQQIANQCMLGLEPTALSRILSSYIRCHSNLASIDKSCRDHVAIANFNSVVLEMCDGLWRDLVFSKRGSSIRTRRGGKQKLPEATATCLFSDSSREFLEGCGFSAGSICSKWNISNHPALLGFVKEFFRKTQGSNYHKLKPTAIWKKLKYTDLYLQYIENAGLTGITGFLQTFIDRSSLNNTT